MKNEYYFDTVITVCFRMSVFRLQRAEKARRDAEEKTVKLKKELGSKIETLKQQLLQLDNKWYFYVVY